MLTDRAVNPGQLQAEALALSGSTHLELTLVGVAPDTDGICPAGGELLCSDTDGSSVTAEPCDFCKTAYDAHVAAAIAPRFRLLSATGAGATGAVASGSNDHLMAGTVTTGTSPSAGDLIAVTFGTPFPAAPLVIQVGALNVAAGNLFAKNVTATGFTIATTATPAASTSYTLWAHIP